MQQKQILLSPKGFEQSYYCVMNCQKSRKTGNITTFKMFLQKESVMKLKKSLTAILAFILLQGVLLAIFTHFFDSYYCYINSLKRLKKSMGKEDYVEIADLKFLENNEKRIDDLITKKYSFEYLKDKIEPHDGNMNADKIRYQCLRTNGDYQYAILQSKEDAFIVLMFNENEFIRSSCYSGKITADSFKDVVIGLTTDNEIQEMDEISLFYPYGGVYTSVHTLGFGKKIAFKYSCDDEFVSRVENVYEAEDEVYPHLLPKDKDFIDSLYK